MLCLTCSGGGELVFENRGTTVTGAVALFNVGSNVTGVTAILADSGSQDHRGIERVFIYTVSKNKNEARLYADGLQQDDTVAHSSTETITKITLGNRASDLAIRGFDGEIYTALILPRAITEAEVQAYSDNIYRDLKLRTQYLPIPEAAVFKPYWANNATVVQPLQGMS